MSEVQYAKIEQPFGTEPPIVHCPICGQESITITDDGSGEYTPCKHLSFIYIGEINEFGYQSSDFESKFDELKIDEEENEDKYPFGLNFDNFSEILEEMGYENNFLAIEITYGGMAGGPVWHTDVFGFDYN